MYIYIYIYIGLYYMYIYMSASVSPDNLMKITNEFTITVPVPFVVCVA